jgi:hypothetical protein
MLRSSARGGSVAHHTEHGDSWNGAEHFDDGSARIERLSAAASSERARPTTHVDRLPAVPSAAVQPMPRPRAKRASTHHARELHWGALHDGETTAPKPGPRLAPNTVQRAGANDALAARLQEDWLAMKAQSAGTKTHSRVMITGAR